MATCQAFGFISRTFTASSHGEIVSHTTWISEQPGLRDDTAPRRRPFR